MYKNILLSPNTPPTDYLTQFESSQYFALLDDGKGCKSADRGEVRMYRVTTFKYMF